MIELNHAVTTLVAALAVQFAPATQTAPTTVASASREVEVPVACDPTGVTDAAGCLNQFLTGLPDGSTVTLPAGARYRAETTLTLLGKSRIVVNGNGATIFATTTGDRGRAHLRILQSSDITVRDLTIRGPNASAGPRSPYRADLEAQAGVDVRGSVRVALDHLDIGRVWGDFVNVAKALPCAGAACFVPSQDVSVTNSHFDGASRQGVAVTNARRVLIEGNQIFNARRSIIDLEPPSSADSVSDVTIRDNVVNPGQFNFVAAASGGPVTTVSITDNVGQNKSLSIVIWDKQGAGRRANFYIARNKSDEAYGSLKKGVVLASNARNIVYENNTQPIQYLRKMYGMWADKGTCGASSSGNTLLDARTGVARPQMGGTTAPCPAGTPSGPPALPAAPAVG